MALLNAYNALTLTALASRTQNQNIMAIAEVLAESNPILDDIPFREANDQLGEKVSRRTSVPTGSYRKINQGVATEAAGTEQLIETIASLEARSEIDKELVDASGSPGVFRSTEDFAFVEGLSQTAAQTLIYGNQSVNPEQLDGYATRRNALSDPNVYGNGGTGSDLTSMFLVKYGIGQIYGIYPKGSPVGLEMRDLGEQTVLDSNSNPYQALVSLFKWKMGIVERDPRCLKRIANIETTGSTNIFDEDLLITALNAFPSGSGGIVIYTNETIKTQMDIYAKDKTNLTYGFAEFGGVPTTTFKGVPVRQNDGILDTETAVV